MNFLSTAFGKIVVMIFNNILDRIQQWMMQKRLEQAESKAKASEAVANGMKEKAETEDKIRAVQTKIDAEWEEAKTARDAYEMIKKAQEARKAAKDAHKEANKTIKS